MPWQVAYEVALEEWEQREHPTAEAIGAVKRWVQGVAEGSIDWYRTSQVYPGDAERYETRLAGSDVYIEFGVFDDVECIGVVRIDTGSRPGG